MMKDLLQDMHAWMNSYMKSFYSKDAKIQEAILLKEKHTGCVTAISRKLAEHLGLSAHDILLAEMMGLFHDIGRFRQFTLYQTFNDAESEDHAELGIKVLGELSFLQRLSLEDRELLLFAIKNHNKKVIADEADERKILFARLLRDADKLDIYRVLFPYILTSDGQGFSPDFLECFLAGEQCDYARIRTQDDRKLVRLMWVYDVNFSWTLQRICDHGYIEAILACLPQEGPVQLGVQRLRAYVERKCRMEDMLFLTHRHINQEDFEAAEENI
jgi:putative nucleotidyltransferase with HDIG domain